MPTRLLRKTAASIAKGVDRAFAGTALNPPQLMRRRSSAEGLGHAQRMLGLHAIEAFYGRERFEGDHRAFFPKPAAIEPAVTRVRELRAAGRVEGEVLDLSWPSAVSPLWTPDAVARYFEALPPSASAQLGLIDGRSIHDVTREIGLDKSGDLASKYLRAKRNRTAHARW